MEHGRKWSSPDHVVYANKCKLRKLQSNSLLVVLDSVLYASIGTIMLGGPFVSLILTCQLNQLKKVDLDSPTSDISLKQSSHALSGAVLW